MAETVGSLVDKITIVALKAYHMRETAIRTEPTTEFHQTCVQRFHALCRQRIDLERELDALMLNPPKPFRQFKMYNDPQYRST